MLNKIEMLYKLIFDKLKFELVGDNLKVFVPENIIGSDKVSIKKFISKNKDFIIDVLKNNNIDKSNILHFDIIENTSSLSFAQERLWFIDKYEEGTNAYNIPMLFKLNSAAILEQLEKSIQSIVKRHEILRTLIKEDKEGNPYQLVLGDPLICSKEPCKNNFSQFKQFVVQLYNSILHGNHCA